MAAVHNQSSRQHPQSRLRSSTDPFVDPTPKATKRPPPPPPKAPPSTRMLVAQPKSTPAVRDPNLTEAVRDTVAFHQQDNNSRHKVNRSQTVMPVPAVPANSRPSARRAQSDDSSNVAEVPRSSGKARKKNSRYTDVIDRLDFTGATTFHHDGPFDACAPPRNKHPNEAPLNVWDESTTLRYGDAAYPSAHAYKAFSNDYPEPPKKKVDAIAEAWGIHEPEPFEEFFAGGGSGKPDGDTPASSIYNGKDSHNSHSAPRGSSTVKDSRAPRDRSNRHSRAPPPRPIFADPSEIALPESPPSASTAFPKRSKSLIHRIRKMRDAPNVPVGPDYDQPPSPSSPTEAYSPNGPRPTHRSQNSFLGRFGSRPQPPLAEEPEKPEKPEPFVYVDTRTNKELPVLPASTSAPEGDIPYQGAVGRKTSIMKKVGRVVRGAK